MTGWYDVVKGEELQQGDFFPDCPVALPPRSPTISNVAEQGRRKIENVAITINTYDVVVLSQSCDLVEHKLNWVLVCPHWSLSEMENNEEEKIRDYIRQPKGKEEIRRGNIPGYHMLAACGIEGFQREIQIADFRSVFSVPFDLLVELARSRAKRLRLLPPYREHLAQAFARFLMRVGLPVDIPPFK